MRNPENTKTPSLFVLEDPSKAIEDIICHGLNLGKDRIFRLNRSIEKDEGLFVLVSSFSSKLDKKSQQEFDKSLENPLSDGIESITTRDLYQVEIFSINDEAEKNKDNLEKIIQSDYSKQKQADNNFTILNCLNVVQVPHKTLKRFVITLEVTALHSLR